MSPFWIAVNCSTVGTRENQQKYFLHSTPPAYKIVSHVPFTGFIFSTMI